MSKQSQAISSIYMCFIALDDPNCVPYLSNKYLDENVPQISLKAMLLLKKQETSDINKEKLDILIARKIISMEYILENNQNNLEKYLSIIENISNIDAIVILLRSKIDEIFDIANRKYYEFYNNILDKDRILENGLNDNNRGKGIIKTKKNRV